MQNTKTQDVVSFTNGAISWSLANRIYKRGNTVFISVGMDLSNVELTMYKGNLVATFDEKFAPADQIIDAVVLRNGTWVMIQISGNEISIQPMNSMSSDERQHFVYSSAWVCS